MKMAPRNQTPPQNPRTPPEKEVQYLTQNVVEIYLKNRIKYGYYGTLRLAQLTAPCKSLYAKSLPAATQKGERLRERGNGLTYSHSVYRS
jgi:hypothetical protein